MARRIRHGAVTGLIAWVAAAGGPAAAQVPPGTSGNAGPGGGRVRRDAPGELQAWDARIDGMIRTGELVVASRERRPDPARPHARVRGATRRRRAGARRGGDAAVRSRRDGVGVRHAPRESELSERWRPSPPPRRAILPRAADRRPAGGRAGAGTDGAPPAHGLPRSRLSGPPSTTGSYHFASAADGRLVHSIDAFRTQSAIGTGHGDPRRPQEGEYDLQERPVRDARPAAPRRDRDPRHRLSTIGTPRPVGRHPGPWNVRRWTVAGHRRRRGQRLGEHCGGRRPRPHAGWTYDYFARQHGLGGRRRPQGPHCIGIVNAFDGYNAFAAPPPPFGPEGRGVVRLRPVRRPGGTAPASRSWRCTSSATRLDPRGRLLFGIRPAHGVAVRAHRRLRRGRVVQVRPAALHRQARASPTTCRHDDLPGSLPVPTTETSWRGTFPAACSDDGRFRPRRRTAGRRRPTRRSPTSSESRPGSFTSGDGATGSYEVGIDSARAARFDRSRIRDLPSSREAYRDRIEFAIVCLGSERFPVDDELSSASFAGVIFPNTPGQCTSTRSTSASSGPGRLLLRGRAPELDHPQPRLLPCRGGRDRTWQPGRSVEGVGAANRAADRGDLLPRP